MNRQACSIWPWCVCLLCCFYTTTLTWLQQLHDQVIVTDVKYNNLDPSCLLCLGRITWVISFTNITTKWAWVTPLCFTGLSISLYHTARFITRNFIYSIKRRSRINAAIHKRRKSTQGYPTFKQSKCIWNLNWVSCLWKNSCMTEVRSFALYIEHLAGSQDLEMWIR